MVGASARSEIADAVTLFNGQIYTALLAFQQCLAASRLAVASGRGANRNHANELSKLLT